MAAVACLLAAGPAAAAPLGTVRLSQTSGTVDATPIFATATASGACPTGYGSNAQVRIGPPAGPFANVAKPLSAGGYDRTAVSAQPNRSFLTALGNTPPVDGEWWVVVECFSETLGMHPDRFVTPITVSGRQWRVGAPAGGAPVGGPEPSASGAAGVTDPSATPPAASPGTEPAVTGTIEPRLTGGFRIGSASFANVWWILGLVGVLAVVGAVSLAARRRPSGGTRLR